MKYGVFQADAWNYRNLKSMVLFPALAQDFRNLSSMVLFPSKLEISEIPTVCCYSRQYTCNFMVLFTTVYLRFLKSQLYGAIADCMLEISEMGIKKWTKNKNKKTAKTSVVFENKRFYGQKWASKCFQTARVLPKTAKTSVVFETNGFKDRNEVFPCSRQLEVCP